MLWFCMVNQLTFRDNQMNKKMLRVEKFLNEMEFVVPWGSLCSDLRPWIISPNF